MMSVYNWSKLTEEERYGYWSDYVNRGGQITNYVAFCDFMDNNLNA